MVKLTKEQSKENANLVAEEIDAMGQESETGAVKWVQEVEKRNQKAADESEGRQREEIEKQRKYQKNPYYQSLYALAMRQIGSYDVPRGYKLEVVQKDNRIIFGLCKIGFRWYAKGMTICGEPKYDINCVQRMVVQTMISLDELVLQHEQHQTKSGIALPVKDKYTI